MDDVVKDIFNKIPLDHNLTIIGRFSVGAIHRIIIQPYRDRDYALAIEFSYATKGLTVYRKVNGALTKSTADWIETAL